MIKEQQVQADFSCETTSDKLDKIKIHESFEIRDPDDISGIPEDKTLLNPLRNLLIKEL